MKTLFDLPVFEDLPDEELRWLQRHGRVQEFGAGEFLMKEDDPSPCFYITLQGEMQVTRTIGGQEVVRGTTPPGIMAGEISLLYGTPSQVSVRALEPSCVLAFDARTFRQIFATCPVMSARIFKMAADRARGFATNVKQQEKMAALGKLSAGLAHELNNPAAAARRASQTLAELLPELQAQSVRLSRLGLSDEHLHELLAVQSDAEHSARPHQALGPLERSDREDEIADWLDAVGVDDAWDKAGTFVDAGFTLDELQRLVQGGLANQGAAPAIVLDWLNAAHLAAHLLAEIEDSTTRISNLVNTVKAYTFMDQAPIQTVDVHEGLENTLRVLQHKLGGVTLVREYHHALPTIVARGSELNQVWTNLVDNAIDATGGAGTVRLITRHEQDYVMVEVADDGVGIPEDVLPRIFEPFFTTKDVGAGAGLGLDMAWRIVSQHGGTIEVQSQPGQTRFIVRVPVQFAGREG